MTPTLEENQAPRGEGDPKQDLQMGMWKVWTTFVLIKTGTLLWGARRRAVSSWQAFR